MVRATAVVCTERRCGPSIATARRYVFEVVCVLLFTVDLVVRGIGATFGGKARAFFCGFLNWIDLLAILPVGSQHEPGVFSIS